MNDFMLDDRARAMQDKARTFEKDAMHVDATEKIFDDDDMWQVYDAGE